MLKFHTGEEIPVHRLVLHACCSFFAALESTEALENSTLHLPAELTRDTLEPVIRFMYTGQLDIGEGSVPSLVTTAQFLDMPLLEQLLQTHALTSASSSPTSIPKAQRPVKTPIKTNYSVASPKSYRTRSELLPAGPSRVDLEVGDSACEFGSLPKLSELLMDAPATPMNPPLLPLLRKTVTSGVKRDLKKAERTFDELRKSTATLPLRRPASNEEVKSPEAKRLREEDIEGFKELLAEQKRRSELAAEQGDDATTYDVAAVGLDDWGEEDEDEDVEGAGNTKCESPSKGQQHKSILKSEALTPGQSGEGKRVHFSVNEEANSATNSSAAAEEPGDSEEKNMQQLMAAAENAGSAGSSTSPDKDSSTITIFNENSEVLLREVVTSNAMSSQVQGRMISEVLKRNPNLVSGGKNTKLKIVQRSPWWAKARVSFVLLKPTSGDEEHQSSGTKPSILRQHNSAAVARRTGASGLGSSGAIAVNKRVSPFDNTSGPWICYDCIQTTDDGQNAALRLKTYYEYRTHLIQNHGFKADSQACEFCGHRAVKRNHMLFHLFTVHGVPPPAHTKFPQCDECDYVALTASIMRKHQLKHQEGSENQCRVCGEPFPAQQSLQHHLHITGHLRGHMRNNPCPAEGCNREFARGMNLKAHIRTCHKDLARQLDEEGWPARLDTGSIVESVAEENVDNGQGVILETNAVEQIQPNEEGEMTWVSEDQVVQLAHGDTFNSDSSLVTVDASGTTEAEALSNMASSIATSLGLPVGTPTTVTTTEDGITVAYITTSDDHSQYITAVDNDTVTLVQGQVPPQENATMEEVLMEN